MPIYESDRLYNRHHKLIKLFWELVFTTSGAVGTLTAARTRGLLKAIQAKAAAAAAGGDSFVFSLTDAFRRIIGLNLFSVGTPAAISGLGLLVEGNGVAAVTITSAAATNAIVIVIPGQGTFTLTAIANGETPGDKQWVLGTGGTTDVDSATALANLINNAGADATQGGYIGLPTGLRAKTNGSVVAIASDYPGTKIKTNEATKVRVVTTAAATANVLTEMKPGFVAKSLVGVTGTVPASGNTVRVELTGIEQE